MGPIRKITVLFIGYQTGYQVFLIQSGYIAQGNLLGAGSFAGTCIGTGTETFLVHLRQHIDGAVMALGLTLWQ